MIKTTLGQKVLWKSNHLQKSADMWTRGKSVFTDNILFTFLYMMRICMYMHAQSYLTLQLHGLAYQAPLSMGFPRQEYWSGLTFPSPGDLTDPGIELSFLVSPASADRFFTIVPPGKPHDEDTRAQREEAICWATKTRELSFCRSFSLSPSLEDSTCFKLSARNTMYTQQKPIWVTIRKKLTIHLKNSREKEKTCYKRRIDLSFPLLSSGVGDPWPAPSVLPPQSTMG